MDLSESTLKSWETQAQIDACRSETGVSQDQITRWRREGLLPAVEQVQDPYHGSLVQYPSGTCKQIAAAARLFKVKKRVPYVGWRLWWEGYPVDEKFWRPSLTKNARLFDDGLARIAKYIIRDEKNSGKSTLQERVAKSRSTNIVMSRIRGRQWGAALATTMATVIQVATGEFEQFSIADANEGEDADKARTIEALDIDASQTDAILENRLELVQEMPKVYAAISRGLTSGALSRIMQQTDDVIFHARDDVRNSLRIYVAQYDATKWIYGPAAFGLRLGAWIGRKQPDWLMPLLILGFAQLRRTSNQFLSSVEIAGLASQAEANAQMSLQIKSLAKADPRFRVVFSPSHVRAGLKDNVAYGRWLKEIEAIRNSP